MNYNPKVVPIDRSAAYVHHRALKNRRDNNPVDALELMRSAVEHSPENTEYKLDLAEMYCEMGCHEQSNRILLDMLAGRDAPAECYYGLALNQLGMNDLESAKRALLLYQNHAEDDDYISEAYGLSAEIELFDTLRRPMNRKLGRASQISDRACEMMKAERIDKAVSLFERSLAMRGDQPEMRALYAMALQLSGRGEEAAVEAEGSIAAPEPSVRALSIAAQVFWMNGDQAHAEETIDRAIREMPEGVELRLLIFALGEMGLSQRAADALKIALREAPHDKALLHMRAVALKKSGADDSQAEPFWLRILRIDPDDTVARYYHDAALRGELDAVEPEYIYEVPAEEYRRRLVEIADQLSCGLEAAAARWQNDRDFRNLLNWAVNTGDENCGRAAAMVIASVGSSASESVLREMFYRSEIPLSVKLHALMFLKLRGAEVRQLLPPDVDARDGMLPEAEKLLPDMPVGERQLVRFSSEVLETEYHVSALSALTVMWRIYRMHAKQGVDPLVRTQEAAAALAWNYLLSHRKKVSADKLAREFVCNRRRMVFYARRIAAVLEMYRGVGENEDN